MIGDSKVKSRIKRLWGNLDVVDASENLRVIIQPEDVNNAIRGDAACCVFAQACKRIFKSTKVLFYRTCAYVELPGDNGVHHIERFYMTRSMRQLVEAFDQGNQVIPEAGFLLKAPSKSKRMDNEYERKRRAEESRNRNKRGKANLIGKIIGENLNDEPIEINLKVRNGSGKVQFSRDSQE